MSPHRRLPVSSRHAFALAFDLAVRRDWFHSLLVPFLLRMPWILVPALVPFVVRDILPSQLALVQAIGLLFDFVAMVVVTSMLRFRAFDNFERPAHEPLGPIGPCYARGLQRVPALYLAEVLRNVLFGISFSMLFLPFLYLAFKLSFATEVVVLRQEGPISGFTRSFKLTEGRFERWLEMIVLSVLLIVPLWFLMAVCFLLVPASSWSTWVALGFLLTAAVLPIVQYAWTFFYLRLEQSVAADEAGSAVVTPLTGAASGWHGAKAPRLRLVEVQRADDDPDSPQG